MKKYGRGAVSDFIGDNIVYRNLEPADPSLPALPGIWDTISLPSSKVPRKTTLEYARVVAYILQHLARINDSVLARVIFVGDTRLNDATAFSNICQAGSWAGLAFIAAEQDAPLCVEVERIDSGEIFAANRWTALEDFDQFLKTQDFPIDGGTAVLLDLDKTTLGARGRNDQVIDQVRLAAANQTIRGLLGINFDQQVFSTAYARLNQPEFHSFTADNQDYLVYICMILSSGLITLDDLLAELSMQNMVSYDQFLHFTEDHKNQLPGNLRRVHADVFKLVSHGDPTPFKEFRYQEFQQTVAHMGHLEEGTSVDELLAGEITLTHEVHQAARRWRSQGALLFGLSDKPDEASIPSAGLASQGYQAIHRVETDIVGA